MTIQPIKTVTAEELAHETSLLYLGKIYLTYIHRLKTRIHSGNIGGVQEDFEPTPTGVMWSYTKDKKPYKFISNETCNKIPQMIREKEWLMKSLKKHQSQKRKA